MVRPVQPEKIASCVWAAFDQVIETEQPFTVDTSSADEPKRLATFYANKFRELQATARKFEIPGWKEYHAIQVIARESSVTLRYADSNPDFALLNQALGREGKPTKGVEVKVGEEATPSGGSEGDPPASPEASSPSMESAINQLYGEK